MEGHVQNHHGFYILKWCNTSICSVLWLLERMQKVDTAAAVAVAVAAVAVAVAAVAVAVAAVAVAVAAVAVAVAVVAVAVAAVAVAWQQ